MLIEGLIMPARYCLGEGRWGGGGVIADSNHSLIGLIHCGKINSSCEGVKLWSDGGDWISIVGSDGHNEPSGSHHEDKIHNTTDKSGSVLSHMAKPLCHHVNAQVSDKKLTVEFFYSVLKN